MSQTRRSSDSERIADNQTKRQEVCGYIFDLLASLETIASQHELPVLSRLIGMAKSEARDCR